MRGGCDSALRRIMESLGPKRPRSFEDCIEWARFQFQARFHNEIAQVTLWVPVASSEARHGVYLTR